MAQKKATIIRISEDVASVGMDDGTFFDISIKELDFSPSIGDEVSIFSNGDVKIVSKLDTFSKNVLSNVKNYDNDEFVASSNDKVSNVFAEYAPNQNYFSQLDGKSKTGLILGICGALAILVAIIIAFANNTSNLVSSDLVQNAYNAGYQAGFVSNDRETCFGFAEMEYTGLYGAPLTADEMSHYREFKASFQKGCLDGVDAAKD